VVHEVEKKDLVTTGDVLTPKVTLRKTNFRTKFNPSEEYSQMLSELTQDHARNALIIRDITKESRKNNGICLVLSDRKSHCHALCEGLYAEHGIGADLLTGDTRKKDRKDIVKRLSRGETKVLVATGQLIGEGFDCKALSTLFLATPIKFDGRVIQYLGRVLRPAPGKKRARVFDYVDLNVGVLAASAKSRARVYAS
jgi:superfamily II DNA or RNA helicase